MRNPPLRRPVFSNNNELAITNLIKTLLASGNMKIDLAGKKTLSDPSSITGVTHAGRSIAVQLADGTSVSSVSGTMSFSRSFTRSMFSYWPLHVIE